MGASFRASEYRFYLTGRPAAYWGELYRPTGFSPSFPPEVSTLLREERGEGGEERHGNQKPWMNEEIVRPGLRKRHPVFSCFSLILKKNTTRWLSGSTHLGHVKWFTTGKVQGGQERADAHSFAWIFYNFAQNTNCFLMSPKTLCHQILDILVAEMNTFHLKGTGKTVLRKTRNCTLWLSLLLSPSVFSVQRPTRSLLAVAGPPPLKSPAHWLLSPF